MEFHIKITENDSADAINKAIAALRSLTDAADAPVEKTPDKPATPTKPRTSTTKPKEKPEPAPEPEKEENPFGNSNDGDSDGEGEGFGLNDDNENDGFSLNEEPEVDRETVRALLTEIKRSGGLAKIRSLFKEFRIDDFKELDDSALPKFYAAAMKLKGK